MTSEVIAKSKKAGITVTLKEKYGPAKTFTDVTVIMIFQNKFYIIKREGTKAVLPIGNWAITSLENKAPDKD